MVDLASMREAIKDLDSNPDKINPLVNIFYLCNYLLATCLTIDSSFKNMIYLCTIGMDNVKRNWKLYKCVCSKPYLCEQISVWALLVKIPSLTGILMVFFICF